MFGDVGLVTGLLDGPQGNGRDRVLRLWVKEGGQWRASIWALHEALETAVGKGDQKTYRMLTTPDFVRVTSDGLAHQREERVSRLKGSGGLARQTNVRLRVFGDLALLTYLNVGQGTGDGPLGRP